VSNTTRQSYAAARERLEALTVNTSVRVVKLAEELAAVTALLDREVSLRRILTDPAQAGEAKAGLVQRLLAEQVSGETLDLVSGMVRSRWSASRDLVDAVEELSSLAEIIGAERSGALDDVEDELFRIARIVASAPDLRAALSDSRATGTAKAELVRTLLSGRARSVTVRLVTRLVVLPRGRSLEAGLDALSKLAAARRGRVVAVVTTAVPVSDRQKRRLGAALATLYGHPVHLNLDVDPEVLGGISVRIGDEVIDSTVVSRLEEATRRLAE
jgi:F-type H+-transporting ATPase subunit delta